MQIACPTAVNAYQFFECTVTLSFPSPYSTLNHTVAIYNNGTLAATVLIFQSPQKITLKSGIKNGYLMEIKAKEMTMYSTATSVVNIIGNLINSFITHKLNKNITNINLLCFIFQELISSNLPTSIVLRI